ncbi:MAG: DEAD/DEAH box helicase [Acidimicrobiales bacterium]
MVALGVHAPTFEDILGTLGGDGRLVHLERIPARPALGGSLARALPDGVARAVPPGGLWSHQADAIDRVRARRCVAITTGTASGKSLCYQLAIGEAVADPVRPGTALLVFPTKALAHDQLRALTSLQLPGVVAACYDGDSSPEERAWVRRHANVVLTNPEMLHCALLPHHARWATFLMRLRFVVLDELHTFRGIFGTHVAHLLRRLRRLAACYGSGPTLVSCSATIGDPADLASALWGDAVEAITTDGSPRGERLVALWNPPLLDDRFGPPEALRLARACDGAEESLRVGRPTRARASAHSETASLLAELIRAGHRTIGFARSRRATEVVAADVRRRLPPELADTVRPYRGGYLPEERRAIETELFGGRLRGVVATTALELGVDVGGLDGCVLDGFPGTIASMWQQMGRAGREQSESLAVLVAGDDQLDQWLLAHPSEVFTRPPEPAVINPSNPFVLLPHLACAAFEHPLTHADERWWPGLLEEGVRALVGDERLKVRPPDRKRPRTTAFYSARGFPAHGVGLRTGSAHEYRIARADGSLVGTVDEGRAFELVHPGAHYVHQGAGYLVTDLDLDDRVAIVEPSEADEYTLARTEAQFRIIEVDACRALGLAAVSLGSLEVVSQVVGFQRKNASTGEVITAEALELPPTTLSTRGFWLTVERGVLRDAGLRMPAWPGTLHAVEHAAIGMLPLFTICDRWDVGGVSSVQHGDTGTPTIVVYDSYPGGAGIAELGYAEAGRLLHATLELVATCACVEGCPSCVQSPKCGNWNEPLDKAGARRLLQRLLELEV